MLSVILLLLGLTPILFSGLYSDDAMNFLMRQGVAAQQEQSAFTLALPDIKLWMSYGRFTPLNLIWLAFVFKHFTTVAGYKAMVFVMNVLAVGVFLLYLKQLNTGIKNAIWLVFFCALIQFRIQYHDPFTSLNAMYQLLAILLFFTGYVYARYITSGNWPWLVACYLGIGITLLFSEFGLLLMVFLPLTGLILRAAFKRIVFTMLPAVLIALVFLGYTAYLRSLVDPNNSYAGLSSNTDPAAMWELIKMQLFAALPLSNFYHQGNIPGTLAPQFASVKVMLLALAMLVVGAAIVLQQKKQAADADAKPVNWWFVLLMLSIVVLPAIIISPSLKYQREMRLGIGYLPVYIQSMGTAGLLACLYTYVQQSITRRVGATFLLVFAVGCTVLSLLFNNALVRTKNILSSYPQMAFQQAVKEGFLDDCEDGSAILIRNSPFWHSGWLYREIFKNLTGKTFMVFDINKGDFVSFEGYPFCYRIDCTPGSDYKAQLYRMHCSGRDTAGQLIKERTFPLGIVLTKEERIILWR